MQSKQAAMEVPPSKLIGQCLQKQKASGEFSLDMDLEMDELNEPPHLGGVLPAVAESPSQSAAALQKVSFENHPINRSGLLGKSMEEDDDDPLLEEDFPDEFKKDKFSVLVLLEWLSLILIIAALVCSLTIPYLKEKTLWKLMLWKWEVMVLKLQRETSSSVLRYVTKGLVCLLIGVMVWLVKTLLVKVLASSFHVSTYFNRIQDSLFIQYAIETLSGPPLVEIQRAEEEEERIANEIMNLQKAGATIPPGLKTSTVSSPHYGKPIGSGRIQKTPRGKSPMLSPLSAWTGDKDDQGISIDHLHKLNHKNASAWNMKRLMNIIHHGALSTLDEQIQHSSYEDEPAGQIRNEYEAKAAARKIFQNVAKPGSRFIYLEDIERFLQEDEALKTMSLFEGASESKRITKKALKNWVLSKSSIFRYSGVPIMTRMSTREMYVCTSYIELKSDHWYQDTMIVFKELEVLNRVRIAIWVTHRMNHQDMGERFTRRALLLEELVKIFNDLDIKYRLYPIDINVCGMPPVALDRLPPAWTGPAS
ncbi:Light-regulated zinc finger protein 1, putative isoform 1 [Hibiscus syriacus]|uniref:Light-regulated zinc finger protein 1, putative isoform 1 n=1 Tax=Hibiscus syriacus TaxID=106335 RepID=A0A6A2ZIJ1_HIBSY|nr:Light-regulated zinc finger protein 1, putative isoform 1 [Hibiscus syriacus]